MLSGIGPIHRPAPFRQAMPWPCRTGPAVPRQTHATLEAAVVWCFGQTQPGDAVLLSPACASWDMFRNYGHRAEVFVQAVQALAHERGPA